MDGMLILKKLFAAYPNTPVTEEGLLVYVEDLQDIPLDKLEEACQKCRRSSEFLPSIAQIRRAAGVKADPKPTEEEDRTGRPALPDYETTKMMLNAKRLPNPAATWRPEELTKEERLARLAKTAKWDVRY